MGPNAGQNNNLEGQEKAFVTTQLFEFCSWASVECQGSNFRNKKRIASAACKNIKVSQRFSQFYTVTTVNSHRPHTGGQYAFSSITHTLPINALRYWYPDCHLRSISNARVHKTTKEILYTRNSLKRQRCQGKRLFLVAE